MSVRRRGCVVTGLGQTGRETGVGWGGGILNSSLSTNTRTAPAPVPLLTHPYCHARRSRCRTFYCRKWKMSSGPFSLSLSPNINLKCLISFCMFNSLIASMQKKEAWWEESPLFVRGSPGGSRGGGGLMKVRFCSFQDYGCCPLMRRKWKSFRPAEKCCMRSKSRFSFSERDYWWCVSRSKTHGTPTRSCQCNPPPPEVLLIFLYWINMSSLLWMASVMVTHCKAYKFNLPLEPLGRWSVLQSS